MAIGKNRAEYEFINRTFETQSIGEVLDKMNVSETVDYRRKEALQWHSAKMLSEIADSLETLKGYAIFFLPLFTVLLSAIIWALD